MMTKTRREGRHQAYLAYGEAVNPAIKKYNAIIVPLVKEFKEFDASIKPDYPNTLEERRMYLDVRREPRAKYRTLKRQAWYELRKVMRPAENVLCNTLHRLQVEETLRIKTGEELLVE